MKLVDRIAPTLEALSLAGLGAALVWMALSGRYGSFVPPSARLGIALSGVALLACSLALSSRLGAGEDEHGHGSTSSRRGLTRCVVAVLAALMLVLPFRVSPSELASTTLSARAADAGDEAGAGTGEQAEESPSEDSPTEDPASAGAGAQSAGQSGGPSGAGAQASSSGTLELTTENFAAQVEELSSHGKVHDGQRVELQDDKLYRIVADLYSGQMLSAVTDMSYGILSIVPKYADGTPIEDFEFLSSSSIWCHPVISSDI